MSRSFVTLMSLLSCLIWTSPSRASDEVVALKAGGGLVRAGVTAQSYLETTERETPSTWEKFKLIRLNGGHVAFQSVYSGKYVRAGVLANSYLAAASDRIGRWERFILVESGGWTGIQSVQSGKFVRVAADLDPSRCGHSEIRTGRQITPPCGIGRLAARDDERHQWGMFSIKYLWTPERRSEAHAAALALVTPRITSIGSLTGRSTAFSYPSEAPFTRLIRDVRATWPDHRDCTRANNCRVVPMGLIWSSDNPIRVANLAHFALEKLGDGQFRRSLGLPNHSERALRDATVLILQNMMMGRNHLVSPTIRWGGGPQPRLRREFFQGDDYRSSMYPTMAIQGVPEDSVPLCVKPTAEWLRPGDIPNWWCSRQNANGYNGYEFMERRLAHLDAIVLRQAGAVAASAAAGAERAKAKARRKKATKTKKKRIVRKKTSKKPVTPKKAKKSKVEKIGKAQN